MVAKGRRKGRRTEVEERKDGWRGERGEGREKEGRSMYVLVHIDLGISGRFFMTSGNGQLRTALQRPKHFSV
jgi:hypothetical protein